MILTETPIEIKEIPMADGSNPITLGDPVPWFTAPLVNGATFDLHVFGGRWVVLAFLGSPANPTADEKIAELMKKQPQTQAAR